MDEALQEIETLKTNIETVRLRLVAALVETRNIPPETDSQYVLEWLLNRVHSRLVELTLARVA